MIAVILFDGAYPGPKAILRRLGRRGHNLNGRQCAWRTELLQALGYRVNPWFEKMGELFETAQFFNQAAREALGPKPRRTWLPPPGVAAARRWMGLTR